jgi:hypothetical protein
MVQLGAQLFTMCLKFGIIFNMKLNSRNKFFLVFVVILIIIGALYYSYTRDIRLFNVFDKKQENSDNNPNRIKIDLKRIDGDIPVEPVSWSVLFYGPNDIYKKFYSKLDSLKNKVYDNKIEELSKSYLGFHKTTEGDLAETVIVELEDSFVGQLVISAYYKTDKGMNVYVDKAIIADRPPGQMKGIRIDPENIKLSPGPSIPLKVYGVFDSGQEYIIFTGKDDIKFESNNNKIVEIDSSEQSGELSGTVNLLSPGTVDIKATYKDKYVAHSTIKVLGSIIITSPTYMQKFDLKINKPFSYQIKTDNPGSRYIVENLPEGLNLDEKTGFISGTPTKEKYYYSEITVFNLDGEDYTQAVEFTIRDTNIAPTEIINSEPNMAALRYENGQVGSLSTFDENFPDKHTYEFVKGVGDENNNLFRIINNYYLCTNIAIDPNINPTLSIRVRSTDDGGLSVEDVLKMDNTENLEYDLTQYNSCNN